jgi:hypothetical protein
MSRVALPGVATDDDWGADDTVLSPAAPASPIPSPAIAPLASLDWGSDDEIIAEAAPASAPQPSPLAIGPNPDWGSEDEIVDAPAASPPVASPAMPSMQGPPSSAGEAWGQNDPIIASPPSTMPATAPAPLPTDWTTALSEFGQSTASRREQMRAEDDAIKPQRDMLTAQGINAGIMDFIGELDPAGVSADPASADPRQFDAMASAARAAQALETKRTADTEAFRKATLGKLFGAASNAARATGDPGYLVRANFAAMREDLADAVSEGRHGFIVADAADVPQAAEIDRRQREFYANPSNHSQPLPDELRSIYLVGKDKVAVARPKRDKLLRQWSERNSVLKRTRGLTQEEQARIVGEMKAERESGKPGSRVPASLFGADDQSQTWQYRVARHLEPFNPDLPADEEAYVNLRRAGVGIAKTPAYIANLAADAAGLVGLDGARDTLRKGSDAYKAALDRKVDGLYASPGAQGFQPDDLNWYVANASTVLPDFAVSLVGAGAAAKGAKALGYAADAQRLAGGVAAFTTGGLREGSNAYDEALAQLQEKGITGEQAHRYAAGESMVVAIANGLLEKYGLESVVGHQVFKRRLVNAARGYLVEGGTEGLQNLVNEATYAIGPQKNPITREDLIQTVNETLFGGIPGVGAGAHSPGHSTPAGTSTETAPVSPPPIAPPTQQSPPIAPATEQQQPAEMDWGQDDQVIAAGQQTEDQSTPPPAPPSPAQEASAAGWLDSIKRFRESTAARARDAQGDSQQQQSQEEAPAAPVEPPADASDFVDARDASRPGAIEQSSGEVRTIPIDQLSVDPARFQYKAGTGEGGASGLLRGVTKFDRQRAGVVAVWNEPESGKTWVVNGHHRFELARRTGESSLNVIYLDAKNASEARHAGALINIAEGRGTATDAAKVFRQMHLDSDALAEGGISLSEGVAWNGLALSKLSPELFNRVATGQIPEGRGAAIGEALADHAQQNALATLLERQENRGRAVANDEIGELARFVTGAGTRTEETGSLFGTEQITASNAIEKARLSAWFKRQLRGDAKLFGTVGRESNAERLRGAGNVINETGAQQTAKAAAESLWTYDQLSTSKGPVSDALNIAAAELGAGGDFNAIATKLKQQLAQSLAETAGGTKPASPLASGAGVEGTAAARTENPAQVAADFGQDDEVIGDASVAPPAPDVAKPQGQMSPEEHARWDMNRRADDGEAPALAVRNGQQPFVHDGRGLFVAPNIRTGIPGRADGTPAAAIPSTRGGARNALKDAIARGDAVNAELFDAWAAHPHHPLKLPENYERRGDMYAPKQTATATKTGLFGQTVVDPAGIGEQKPLFHEPVDVPRPPAEQTGSKSATDPKNTAEMFPAEDPQKWTTIDLSDGSTRRILAHRTAGDIASTAKDVTPEGYGPSGDSTVAPDPEGKGPSASPAPSGPSSPQAPIGVTGKELSASEDAQAVREAARQFAREHLQGTSVLNRDTGREIQISRAGIDKSLSSTADIRRAKVLVALPAMLREARYVLSTPAEGTDANIKAFHRFQVDVDYAGNREPMKLLVREDNNGNWFYNHDFGDVQAQKKDSPASPGGTTAEQSQTTPAYSESKGIIGTPPPTVNEKPADAAQDEENDTIPPEPEGGDRVGTPSNAMPPKTMAGTGKVQATPLEIIKQIEEVTGTPIRQGHGWFGQMNAVGWFDRHTDSIRQRSREKLDVALHEAGHSIHEKIVGWNTRWPSKVAAELQRMGRELYGNRQPNGGYRREGFAEYVARSMLGDNMAISAPETDAWFKNTILPAHPDFATGYNRLAEMMRAWDQQGAIARVDAKVDHVSRGLIPRAKDAASRFAWLFSREAWMTDAARLEKAEARLLAEHGLDRAGMRPNLLPSSLRSALKMNAPGTARHFIFEEAVNRRGTAVGPSLRQVLEPVARDIDNFVNYAYARRAEVLLDRGINPGISREDAAYTVKHLETPEFKAASDGITQWSDHLLDYIVESGGLSPEAAKTIRDLNPVYLPLKRFFGDDEIGGPPGMGARGVVNQGKGIKRIKGSERTIIDPIESLVQQAAYMIQLGNRIRVARAVAEFAESIPGSAWFAEKVEPPKEVSSTTIEALKKQLVEAGADLTQADMDHVLNIFSQSDRYLGKSTIVSLWRNGKREFWQLDPDVYHVVTDMDKETIPWFLRWLTVPARTVRLGATQLRASFGIANGIRDAMDASVYGQTVHTPAASLVGLWQQMMKTETAKQYDALGLEMASMHGQDRIAAARAADELERAAKGDRIELNPFKWRPLQFQRSMLSAIEAAPRIAEFKGVLERSERKWGKGSEAAVIEAMNASKDLTVNFTRMSMIGSWANQIYPFFNARVQATSKFFRAFGHDPMRTSKRMAMKSAAAAVSYITIPSILLWWSHRDEPWWQELPEYEKFNYWHFSFDGGKTIHRVPVPFEVGKVFGVVPVQFLDKHYHKGSAAERRELNDAMWDSLSNFLPLQSLPDLVPAYIRPGIEAKFNEDGFRNRAIVPEHLQQSKIPAEQFTEYTTATAKAIGKFLGVSPMKVEHVVSGYTGGLGLDAARFVDAASHAVTNADDGRSIPRQTVDAIKDTAGSLVERFVTRNPLDVGTAETIRTFYGRQKVLAQKKGSGVATREELYELDGITQAARRMSEARKDESLKPFQRQHRVLNEARQAMGKGPIDFGDPTASPGTINVMDRISHLNAKEAVKYLEILPEAKRRQVVSHIRLKIIDSTSITGAETRQLLDRVNALSTKVDASRKTTRELQPR